MNAQRIKTFESIWNYCLANEEITIGDMVRETDWAKGTIQVTLATLRKHGCLDVVGKKHHTLIYKKTGIPWEPGTPTKRRQPLGDRIVIEIKPDIAAGWVNPSLLPLGKRSIPIVRSIGLGVRQSMC